MQAAVGTHGTVLLRHERVALLAMHSLFLEGRYQKELWRAVLRVRPRASFVQVAVAALHSLVEENGVGSAERYCLIHAIMLHCRQHCYPAGLQSARCSGVTGGDTPTPAGSVAMAAAAPAYDALLRRWPGRELAIPAWAVDKHTRRGGKGAKDSGVPGVTVKGENTVAVLHEGARHWGVDVTGWSAEELAKSQGNGIERSCHTGLGEHTLLTHFYRHGVVVEDENIPGGDADPCVLHRRRCPGLPTAPPCSAAFGWAT